MNELTNFEQDALKFLLAGESEVLSSLRNQLPFLKVEKRTFSGVGFFLDMEVEFKTGKGQPIDKSFQLSDVVAEVDGLEYGVGFVLFVENGVLSALEGYTYDGEEWPSEIQNYKLTYVDGEERAMDDIERLWL